MKLVLEDGTELIGQSFGFDRVVTGEVVFNTGMAGYIESLTDPSYRGQILVLTYPLIGNYGVPDPRKKGSITRPYESDSIQVQGLVVSNYVDHYSHYQASRSLGVLAPEGEDTRHDRRRHAASDPSVFAARGTMKGWLFPSEMELSEARKRADAVAMDDEVFRLVAPKEPVSYEGGGSQRVMLIDVGAKDNIVRSLTNRGANVLRVPWFWDFEKELGEIDGIVIGKRPRRSEGI